MIERERGTLPEMSAHEARRGITVINSHTRREIATLATMEISCVYHLLLTEGSSSRQSELLKRIGKARRLSPADRRDFGQAINSLGRLGFVTTGRRTVDNTVTLTPMGKHVAEFLVTWPHWEKFVQTFGI